MERQSNRKVEKQRDRVMGRSSFGEKEGLIESQGHGEIDRDNEIQGEGEQRRTGSEQIKKA